MIELTLQQARRFLLLKHGLLGEHRFIGKPGALAYVHQTGCIQYDPVDACGKNAELTFQSRIKGFTKAMLYELLYTDRALVDYPDKNLSIIEVADWCYFERYRNAARECGLQFAGLAELEQQAKDYIRANGPVSSDELPLEGSMHWHSAIHWSGNWGSESNTARSVLEQLYSTGELVIHHKNGTRKYYDLAENHISPAILSAPDPIQDEFEHRKWRVLRRIGAVGLLWNRPSDAWLNIWGLKSPERAEIFTQLLADGSILAVAVEGMKHKLYCRAEDLPLIEAALQGGTYTPRCEFIAPLDCMMWDRKLIKALFNFDYTWEIYTPADKRKYGYYVLPILYGEGFAGRIEAVADKKCGVLTVKHIWYEDGVKVTKKLTAAVNDCIKRLARLNNCDEIVQIAIGDQN